MAQGTTELWLQEVEGESTRRFARAPCVTRLADARQSAGRRAEGPPGRSGRKTGLCDSPEGHNAPGRSGGVEARTGFE